MDFEGMIFKFTTRGMWMQKSNVLFYKLVAFKQANIDYSNINNYDWLLVNVGFQKYLQNYIGNEFDTKVWEAKYINKHLKDILKFKEVETVYGWIQLTTNKDLEE